MYHLETLVFELKAVTGWDLIYDEWILSGGAGEEKAPMITWMAREADCGGVTRLLGSISNSSFFPFRNRIPSAEQVAVKRRLHFLASPAARHGYMMAFGVNGK